MTIRLLLPCLLVPLLALALPAAPSVVVLRGDALAAQTPSLKSDVTSHAQRVGACLRQAGLPFELVSDQGLRLEALAAAKFAILPYNKLDDAQCGVLEQFVAGGGQLLACFTTGSARLPRLLGVELGALAPPAAPGELDTISLEAPAQLAYPGLPGALRQDSWNAFVLRPLAGTTVLGRWGTGADARPALTANRAGYYLGHVLLGGDLAAKSRLLLALAAKADPSLWGVAVGAAGNRLDTAAKRVTAWREALAARGDVPDDERRPLLAEADAWLKAARPGASSGSVVGLLDRLAAAEAAANALAWRLQPSRRHELRGLWVYGGKPLDWPALVAKCQRAGLNAIFYRVARGGDTVYPSTVLPQAEWSKGSDEVATGLAACHAAGIEFHAWRVCFHLGTASSDWKEKLRAEGRISLDPTGAAAPFANPGDPRNQAVEREAVREFLARYDVDGLQLDYIRYTDEPSFNFDYSPVSRQQFEQVLGQPVAHWPDDVLHGPLKLRYTAWMCDTISAVVRDDSVAVHELRPHAVLSASVWRDPRIDRQAIKQDWPRWVREGWLDLVIPMNYTTSLDTLSEYTQNQLGWNGGRARYAAGLGSWLLDSPEQLLEQVALARAGGAEGFVLFSVYTPDLDRQLEALAAGATKRPAVPVGVNPTSRWLLPDAMAPTLGPSALLAQAPTRLWMELGPGWGTWREAVKHFQAEVWQEDPATGRRLAQVGTLAADGPRASLAKAFTPLLGRIQLVASGTLTAEGGRTQAFELRGPLLDGWTPAQAEAWRMQSQVPRPQGHGPAVGVWHDGIGAEPLQQALAASGKVSTATVYQLTPEHLAPLRALLVPQVRDVLELDQEPATALRQWVESGGVLVLLHDAVGFRWHPTLFPQIGSGKAVERSRVVLAGPAWPEPAFRLEHRYADHLRLQPATGAEVLLLDEGRAPVVVAGPLGRGRVVLDGMMSGYVGAGADAPAAEEVALLLRLLGP